MSSSSQHSYDFVIVGGGTSGAVVAGNLARSRQRPRVLVIEGGGDNKRPDLRVPSERFVNVYKNPEIGTRFATTPQPHLNGRTLDYIRGNGLGGSSIANFQAYIRGAASDYDECASRVGDDFFAWKNAMERFKELEHLHFDDDGDENQYIKLRDGAHGFAGPVDMSLTPRKDWQLGMDKLMEAVVEFGWPVCRDQNSGNPIGVGAVTTTTYNGYRTTSASAYLNDAPSNLAIWCHATAVKIIFEEQASGVPKAVGVHLADGREVRATSEVILSAGVIDTPKLLLLSGIGPRDELAEVAISSVVDHPDIGTNLIDHLYTCVHWSVSPEFSDKARFTEDTKQAAASREEWLHRQTGPDAHHNIPSVIGFLKFHPDRSNPDALEQLSEHARRWIEQPDVPQIEIFLKAPFPAGWRLAHDGEFAGLSVMLMNPQSRGQIRLSSPNPLASPVADPGYFSHPYDRRTMVDGIREALTFMRSTSLRHYIRKETSVPRTDSDADILEYCRNSVESVLHGCGAVRMGRDGDARACLDSKFRVRGVDKLRVMDLSVTPLITSNHTQATAFVIRQMGWKRLAEEYGLTLLCSQSADL